MSHQLSHTFPIYDAEAQTPVKPLSFSPHSGLKPPVLPLRCLSPSLCGLVIS